MVNRAVATGLGSRGSGLPWPSLEPLFHINWAVAYLPPAFALQALLLCWFGGLQGRMHFEVSRSPLGAVGFMLLLYALAVHPFVAMLAGRPFAAAEVFGIAPDPTSLLRSGCDDDSWGEPRAWLLLIVPLAWCLCEWATSTRWDLRKPGSLSFRLVLPPRPSSGLGNMSGRCKHPDQNLPGKYEVPQRSALAAPLVDSAYLPCLHRPATLLISKLTVLPHDLRAFGTRQVGQ
jgi:hypothetical protein